MHCFRNNIALLYAGVIENPVRGLRGRLGLAAYGMIRVYLMPSNVAPKRRPTCANTTATTGLNVVVVSAFKESP